ncbi:GNAT family N-acetyltransferase [Shinella sp.]|uniref:GNAT family N-acetyltransferase n=1 Tax=Shinella sp. TaxID=1870904 RepID=UPI003F7188FC
MTGTFPSELARGAVLLRQWKAADFEFYASFLGSDDTARFYGGVLDRQKAWRHLASLIGHWSLNGFGVYAVEDVQHGRPQGCVGLWEPFGWPCREFVYWFTPDAYAAGLAGQAVQLALDGVRATFPDEAIQSFVHPDNHEAVRLAYAAGGTAEGPMPLADYGPHLKFSFPHS